MARRSQSTRQLSHTHIMRVLKSYRRGRPGAPEDGCAAVPASLGRWLRAARPKMLRAVRLPSRRLERLPRHRSLPAAPLLGSLHFGCGARPRAGLARLGAYLSRGATPLPAALSVISPVEKTNPSVEATTLPDATISRKSKVACSCVLPCSTALPRNRRRARRVISCV